jgi:hypothetical protein
MDYAYVNYSDFTLQRNAKTYIIYVKMLARKYFYEDLIYMIWFVPYSLTSFVARLPYTSLSMNRVCMSRKCLKSECEGASVRAAVGDGRMAHEEGGGDMDDGIKWEIEDGEEEDSDSAENARVQKRVIICDGGSI